MRTILPTTLAMTLSIALATPHAIAQQPGAIQGGPSAGQQTPESVAPATAVRTDRAPIIDGSEDDAVWATAPATAQFLEFQPAVGKAPRYRTEFKVAYDDRSLFVFVRADRLVQ